MDDQNIIMTLKDLKSSFTNSLNSLYPKNEIENFYFLLIEEKMNLKRVDIALNPDRLIHSEERKFFETSLKKLNNEIPIQYIIGHTEFYGLPFNLNPDTLIPRPETEELVSWVLTDIQNTQFKKPINILDIGTGSGCIAISIAKNIPNANVWGYDISNTALKTAKSNSLINNVQVHFELINILSAKELNNTFDIIVSNPPYVRNLEKFEIKNNVLLYEPHRALFVDDNDPLIFYNKITELAKAHLKSDGLLYFEINQYLGTETTKLIQKKGFKNIELRKDIFNNDRMIKAYI